MVDCFAGVPRSWGRAVISLADAFERGAGRKFHQLDLARDCPVDRDRAIGAYRHRASDDTNDTVFAHDRIALRRDQLSLGRHLKISVARVDRAVGGLHFERILVLELAKSRSLPVCSRLPWVRSIWLPPEMPKSLTA